MTNVSLVPHEMLSAGCIPVVNEAEQNRVVLDNPFVRYAPPTPQALAGALGDVVATKNFAALATSASDERALGILGSGRRRRRAVHTGRPRHLIDTQIHVVSG